MATGRDEVGFTATTSDTLCPQCGSKNNHLVTNESYVSESPLEDRKVMNSERECLDCGSFFTRCNACKEVTISKDVEAYAGFWKGIPFPAIPNEIFDEAEKKKFTDVGLEIKFDGEDCLEISWPKKSVDMFPFVLQIVKKLSIGHNNAASSHWYWGCKCGHRVYIDTQWEG